MVKLVEYKSNGIQTAQAGTCDMCLGPEEEYEEYGIVLEHRGYKREYCSPYITVFDNVRSIYHGNIPALAEKVQKYFQGLPESEENFTEWVEIIERFESGELSAAYREWLTLFKKEVGGANLNFIARIIREPDMPYSLKNMLRDMHEQMDVDDPIGLPGFLFFAGEYIVDIHYDNL